MTAKIKRAVRLRIREAEMLERIRPPFLIGAARGILEFFLRFFFLWPSFMLNPCLSYRRIVTVQCMILIRKTEALHSVCFRCFP